MAVVEVLSVISVFGPADQSGRVFSPTIPFFLPVDCGNVILLILFVTSCHNIHTYIRTPPLFFIATVANAVNRDQSCKKVSHSLQNQKKKETKFKSERVTPGRF